MLALSIFALNGKDSALESKNIMSEFIKQTIRTEVSAIGLKLLIGIVLVSTIIFSIIQLGQVSQTLLRPLENGSIIELVIFSIVVVLCLIMLYLLFKNWQTNSAVKKNKDQFSSMTVDLQSLGIKFAEGILEGLESAAAKIKEEKL